MPGAEDSPSPVSQARLRAGLLLALLAVAFATLVHVGSEKFCRVSSYVDCDRITNSAYGSWFGVPVSIIAIGVHLVLAGWLGAALYSPALRAALLPLAGALSLFSGLGSVTYAVISNVVLKGLCPMCTGIQLCDLGLAFLVGIPVLRARRFHVPVMGWSAGVLLAAHALLMTQFAALYFYKLETEAGVLRLKAGMTRSIDLADSPVLGDPDAPVQVVAFLDFGCPYCKATYQKMLGVLRSHPGRVGFFIKHFPLDVCNTRKASHPGACDAAFAMQAAHRADRAARGMQYLFEERFFAEKILQEIGRRLRVPDERWKELRADPVTRELVQRDIRDGQELGLLGVPALFINGRFSTHATFRADMEAALRKH